MTAPAQQQIKATLTPRELADQKLAALEEQVEREGAQKPTREFVDECLEVLRLRGLK